MPRVCRRAAASASSPSNFRTVLETLPDLGFFETHAENYMVDGGPLTQIRSHYSLSIHGVGLSIGGEGRLDEAHLDLLPAPYHAETLNRVCAHVDRVQERLGRRMLLDCSRQRKPGQINCL